MAGVVTQGRRLARPTLLYVSRGARPVLMRTAWIRFRSGSDMAHKAHVLRTYHFLVPRIRCHKVPPNLCPRTK